LSGVLVGGAFVAVAPAGAVVACGAAVGPAETGGVVACGAAVGPAETGADVAAGAFVGWLAAPPLSQAASKASINPINMNNELRAVIRLSILSLIVDFPPFGRRAFFLAGAPNLQTLGL
jgi:hypothetical protein